MQKLPEAPDRKMGWRMRKKEPSQQRKERGPRSVSSNQQSDNT